MPRHESPAANVDVADAAARIRQLEAALESRTVIARAQGIIMERYEVDADAAVAVLRRISNNSNVPVREVAQYLVTTRHLPRGSERGETGTGGH